MGLVINAVPRNSRIAKSSKLTLRYVILSIRGSFVQSYISPRCYATSDAVISAGQSEKIFFFSRFVIYNSGEILLSNSFFKFAKKGYYYLSSTRALHTTSFASTFFTLTTTMPSVIAALRLRALVKEIFAEPGLLRTATQSEILTVVEEIAETNPFYARTFLSEFVRWMESEESVEDEENDDMEGESEPESDVVAKRLGISEKEGFETVLKSTDVPDSATIRADLHPKGSDSECDSAQDARTTNPHKHGKRYENGAKTDSSDESAPNRERQYSKFSNLDVQSLHTVLPTLAAKSSQPSKEDPNSTKINKSSISDTSTSAFTQPASSFDNSSSNLKSEPPATSIDDPKDTPIQQEDPESPDPYELLCSLLSAKPLAPTAPDILQYPIDFSSWVSIRETPRVISGQGTTGARTWNAAQLLALLLNTDPRFEGAFRQKTVLELGAGTGLVSLALAKKWDLHQLKGIIATDGDAGVVEKLPEIIRLNNLESGNFRCAEFLWDQSPIPEGVDVVLGADIVYDPSVLEVLLKTIGDFLIKGASYAVISRSDRNPDTSRQWEARCDELFLREIVRVEDPRKSTLPCWFHGGANDITVEILSLKK